VVQSYTAESESSESFSTIFVPRLVLENISALALDWLPCIFVQFSKELQTRTVTAQTTQGDCCLCAALVVKNIRRPLRHGTHFSHTLKAGKRPISRSLSLSTTVACILTQRAQSAYLVFEKKCEPHRRGLRKPSSCRPLQKHHRIPSWYRQNSDPKPPTTVTPFRSRHLLGAIRMCRSRRGWHASSAARESSGVTALSPAAARVHASVTSVSTMRSAGRAARKGAM